jgi:phospho-N-acetylmuramoyl-pentapeptide-transferase
MLLILIEFLHSYGIKVPAVFEYYSTRMILAAITALLVTIFLGKRFIKKLYEWKIGESVRVEDCPLLGQLHKKKTDTPTMGGILILFAILLSMLLWMNLKSPFTLLMFLTTVIIGGAGAVDDYLKLRYKNKKGMPGRIKMAIQISFSLFVALYLLWPPLSEAIHMGSWFIPPHAKEIQIGASFADAKLLSTQDYAAQLYIPFFKTPLHFSTPFLMIVMALFISFVITGCSNAVNLTDGLDGLAAGTVLFAASSFALVAFVSNNYDIASYLHILYIEGSGEIAIYLSALAGACLGFLWYNGHPAQVFMGDTGSLPLGAILGVAAVLLRREFLLALIGGIFFVEALSVLLQVGSYKLRNKKRVFLCAPLHHHFEYKGWSETKIVLRFWIIGLLLAICGIASFKFQ